MIRAIMLFTLVALAGCGGPDPVANDEHSAALPEPANQASASPSGDAPPNAVTEQASNPGAGAAIPAALRGRWGLSPGDCTSTGGDAKGLLVVDAGKLQFYESRAVPSPGIQTSADSVSGNFAFTGEGQEWVKHQTLELQNGKLVRTERDPLGTFTYVRCE